MRKKLKCGIIELDIASCYTNRKEKDNNMMKKQNIRSLIKEAVQFQGKRSCAGGLAITVFGLLLSIAAFTVGMPICGSLAVAGVLALGFCFYWFAVRPLTVEE